MIYEINFYKDKGLFDLSDYSAFPGENEILVQDGLDYNVISIEQQKFKGKDYHKIILRHPPVKNFKFDERW